MTMLYFSHMNFRHRHSPELNTQESGLPFEITIFLQELSPFGIFLSQLIRMTGWLFPGNTLPASWLSVAQRLESMDLNANVKEGPDVFD